MDLCHTIQYWIVFVLTQLSWIPLYLSYLLAKLIMGRNPYFFFICMQCGRLGFDPWVRKIPWGREWLCTPVFLPGESQGQRSLAGYCLRVRHNWATNTFTFTAQSCPTLCDPMDCSPALQTPLSMKFSRQEYWSGLPCPSSGDLPDQGIEPASPRSSALQVDSLQLSHLGSPISPLQFE